MIGSKARTIIFILSITVYLLLTLFGFKGLEPLLSMICVTAVLVSIPKCGRGAKAFTLLFLGGGTWFLLQKGTSVYEYILTFGDMLFLLSLFAIVPVLAIPIKIGKYGEAIQQLMERKQRTDTQYYRLITSISFLLGSFLSLATLPIMYHSVKGTIQKWAGDKADKFVMASIVHGYAVSATWTPVSGIPGIVLNVTKVHWQNIVFVLGATSIGGLFATWAIYLLIRRLGPSLRLAEADAGTKHAGQWKTGESELAAASESDRKQAANPTMKMMQISLAVAVLVIIVLILSKWLHLNIVFTATLIALPFAYVWSLLLKKGSLFMKGTLSHLTDHLPAMSEQFAIFLSAGFFVKALHASGQDHYVNQYFIELNHWMGGQIFLILLPLLTLIFSFIGMHPYAVITLLGESLQPALLGITPEHLTIALTGGAVLTFFIGPVSGTTGVASALVRKSPFQIVGWSALQALGYYAVLAIVLVVY